MDNLRLRSSVGIVLQNNYIDFFRSNVRESVILKMDNSEIISILQQFDGNTSLYDICQKNALLKEQLEKLALYLQKEHILINQDVQYPIEILSQNMRLINLLEDYCVSTGEVLSLLDRLKSSKVMIIGLGAVGSFIAVQLAQLSVGKFIFVDNDVVDISNLHRQYYFEEQLGQKKAEALKSELLAINPNIEIDIIPKFLTTDFFEETNIPSDINIIINCADEPNVDTTSRIVSQYAMRKNIPHIVGGGYNLHLTLIGQTIIPYKTACFECFNLFLKDLNDDSLKNVRKLHRENRKLGAFSPLSGIAANLAALDAFKILIGKLDKLQQTNKRIEFNVKNNQFNVMSVERYDECKWCGSE